MNIILWIRLTFAQILTNTQSLFSYRGKQTPNLHDGLHTRGVYGWLSVRVPDHFIGHVSAGEFNAAGRLKQFRIMTP